MPKAFVLMPFADELREVYDNLIKGALEEAGYDVERADDLDNQRSILRDILTSIDSYDLIVADLTDNNPNVYYELGLAHGLARPVILLTQSIESVPFDLRSYRIIPYRRDFVAAAEMRGKLLSVAKRALSGQIEFGSPATDFLGLAIRYGSLEASIGERGIIDRLADFEEGTDRALALMEKANQAMNGVTADANELSDQLGYLVSSGSPRPNSQARQHIRAFAGQIVGFSKILDEVNREYPEALSMIQDGLDQIVATATNKRTLTPDEVQQVREATVSIRAAAEAASDAYESTAAMTRSIKALLGHESTLNAAAAQLKRNAKTYTDNFKMTEAVLARVVEALEGLDVEPL